MYFDGLLFDTGTGISSNMIEEPNISVFPNPAQDLLTITSAADVDRITLFNAQGQMVAQHALRKSTGVVDISALSSGVYTLRATTRNSTVVLNVVKQ